MKIENKTLFHAEALPLIALSGETALTVIVKATFEIESGAPAKEQQPIAFGDEFAEEGVVRYESDIIPVKPATDVALFATAHAPDNAPAECVPVSVSPVPPVSGLLLLPRRIRSCVPISLLASCFLRMTRSSSAARFRLWSAKHPAGLRKQNKPASVYANSSA